VFMVRCAARHVACLLLAEAAAKRLVYSVVC
jgi:hypothetical protein